MKFKDFFQNKKWKNWDKSQWTIVILTGILLMILAIPVNSHDSSKKEENQKQEVTDVEQKSGEQEDYAETLERKLEDVLSQIEGAGRVHVMITLEDTGESVVEKDSERKVMDTTETDSAGGTRRQQEEDKNETTVYKEDDDGKEPFIGKEKTPKIAGILVVAQGGENTAVKQNISEAVMALFQIDVNRIKVVKMNIQEEEY